jgi:vancomycin resistance protein YoaR
MRRALFAALVALAAVLGVVVLVLVAWSIDTGRRSDRVVRNVELAGRAVGGMSRAELTAVVREVAARYEGAQIEVRAPQGGFTTTAKELGASVSPEATIEEALDVGREGALLGRLTGWMASFVSDRRAPIEMAVEPAAVYKTVAEKDLGPRTPATEPGVKVQRGRLVAVEGKPGRGIDPADIIDELPDAARNGRVPIRLEVERGEVAPRFSQADAEEVAREGERLVRTALPVQADETKATVPVATLRSWVTAIPSDDALVLAIDDNKAVDDLAKLLPDVGTKPTETSFTLRDGTPAVVPGKPGTGCCAIGSGDVVLQALRTRPKDPVALRLRKVDPKLTPEKAADLGVKEKVGTFTTTYAAGQPRVTNIHRIADLVRGAVIQPGATFSVNEHVGRRTPEKGFVVAGQIEDGVLTQGVGGGVSQFATTLFNAAYFAGLDFGEYQAHSIFFDRYPKGREATMGYPHPDLEIKNTTPYGVLIWTSYTKTTVTVTLYSTKYVDVEQTGYSEAPRGPCLRVVTDRTRLYLDGTTKKDRTAALYRPEEGVQCP